MKKLVLSLALVLALFGMNDASAQRADGYFNYNSISESKKEYKLYDNYVKSDMDINTDLNRAPLGSGLLLLGGMVLVYAVRKRTVEN